MTNELATTQPAAIQTLEQMEGAAEKLALSGLMGPKTTKEMVYGLMLLCQCEGLNPVAAMKRYHIVEGRPSMRADAMQAEFQARGGAIIFHVRTDEMVAATLFAEKGKVDDAARARAAGRFEAMWALDCEPDPDKRSKLMVAVSKFSIEGEETIIRTFADCQAKRITEGANGTKANWKTSPRQMLTARVITEGVRLVNPGLIAGIYSEDETADIVRQEKEALAKMIEAPTAADKEIILEIIAGYDKELETAEGSRRKTLLGLRSDLVCKLGDIGITPEPPPEEPTPTVGGVPAKTVEATVIPPEKPAPKKRQPAPTASTTKPAPEPATETPWQSVICHLGPEGGKVHGKTVGEIFEGVSEKVMHGLRDWFKAQAEASEKTPQDLALENAVAKAVSAWQTPTPKTTTTAPEPTPAAETAPKAAEAPQQAASAQGWRGYVIASKSADWHGKKLGDLSPEQLKTLSDEYVSKIEVSRATTQQKSLIANLALALAEVLPPAAKADDEPHTIQLREAIAKSSLNRNSFMSVCIANGYIPDDCKRIEDISAPDAEQLLSGWGVLAEEVKAAQP
jgi:hypothetical protein